MALTADDKKLFRKYLKDQADRADKALSARYQERYEAIVAADKKRPITPEAVELLEQLKKLASHYNDLHAKLDTLGFEIADTNRSYYNNALANTFDSVNHATLSTNELSPAAKAQIAALDTLRDEARERIADEAARAQLTVIAKDAPELERQLVALRDTFTSLIQGL